MRFDTVLIDIDDTLFDFRKSSYQALVKAFSEIGFSFGEQEMREYEVFNNQMWKSFELGEIEKEFIYAELPPLFCVHRLERRPCGNQPAVSS